MSRESRRLRDVSANTTQHTPHEAFSGDDLDALEALAEFEIEHRRILAMQTLYYRRRKPGGVA
jgi:hypothetical protein